MSVQRWQTHMDSMLFDVMGVVASLGMAVVAVAVAVAMAMVVAVATVEAAGRRLWRSEGFGRSCLSL